MLQFAGGVVVGVVASVLILWNNKTKAIAILEKAHADIVLALQAAKSEALAAKAAVEKELASLKAKYNL